MPHYLYYKLYRASLKSSLKDMPRFMTTISFGGLIAANVFVIFGLLAALEYVPFYTNKHQSGLIFIIFIILTALYFNSHRVTVILAKYSQESNKARIRGNILVSVYVLVSFLSIFGVGLFKASKLF